MGITWVAIVVDVGEKEKNIRSRMSFLPPNSLLLLAVLYLVFNSSSFVRSDLTAAGCRIFF
jgi:hypothetical protein